MTTEAKLDEMEKQMEEVNTKLDEVLHCLKGNDMGSEGLLKKIDVIEKKVHAIEESRISERTKSDIYMGIIKWLAGTILALIITYMFSQIYKNKS